MNREQKREMLRRYPFLSIQLQNLKDRYEEVYTEATKITPGYSDSGGGTHNNDSKIEKQCIKLADLSKRIEKVKAKQRRIDKALSKVKPYYRFLLTQIDINDQGIKRVAHKLHKDPSSLARTYYKALEALDLGDR